jgi:hypothetical protein
MQLNCGPRRWTLLSLLALACVALFASMSSSAFAAASTLTVDNDANHDGIFSDTENVAKNATYPYTVTFRVTLTAGPVPATVQTLTDDKTPPPLDSASQSPDCSTMIGVTIAANSSQTCYFDATLLGPGSAPRVNTTSFTFNGQGQDRFSDTSTVNFPSLSIEKSSTTTLVTAAGQVVPYSYLVTNTGTSTVTGIVVTDNNVDAVPSCPSSSLAVGTSMTCTAQHTATAAELLAGHVNNAVTATSNEAPNATDTLSIPAAPFATGGSFVVGDLTVGPIGNAVGKAVTFWGAQWWKLNSLTGGDGPAAFKGFQDTPAQPACGLNWTSRPGNSTPPPATIPPFLAIIVSSAISQNGSSITGDTLHIVIVSTKPGYEGNPGHAGTGTIVGVVC